MWGIATRIGGTLAGLLVIALLSRAADALGDDSAALREHFYRDVYVAITLAGYPCGSIKTVVQTKPSDYSVQCQNGKRYRVYATDDELVHVVDRSPGIGAPGATREDHESQVARSLFAIVNLSGYDCDEVAQIERQPRLAYSVRCRNGTQYRISVKGDGRVRVEPIP
jgi:hypothetical protein